MDYLYVCRFSNGTIKVGRSIDPVSRIASHIDRVSCMGIQLLEHQAFECTGGALLAEADLIEMCVARANSRQLNEWFTGLDFTEVCAWADECAARQYIQPSA